MSNPHELVRIWNLTAEAFDQRLPKVTDDDWPRPTPCEGWTVQQLVDHAVDVQHRLAGRLGLLDEGSDWTATRCALGAGLQTLNLAEVIPYGPLGEASKLVVLGFATNDLLVHTWDLARAIGADEHLPPDAVDACYLICQQAPPAVVRQPNVWGTEPLVFPPNATTQAQLLAFVGRASW